MQTNGVDYTKFGMKEDFLLTQINNSAGFQGNDLDPDQVYFAGVIRIFRNSMGP
jgi:hypothetical protein